MRIVVLDSSITHIKSSSTLITPLDGEMDRLVAKALGCVALVAEHREPKPNAFVIPLRFRDSSYYQHDSFRPIASENEYYGLQLAGEIRACKLDSTIILTDRRPLDTRFQPLEQYVTSPVKFMMEPWLPDDLNDLITDSDSAEPQKLSGWPRPVREELPSSDPGGDAVSFLKQLLANLEIADSAETLSLRVRNLVAEIWEDSSDIPGSDIVVQPALRLLERFPWGEDSEYWNGLIDYCSRYQLHRWASTQAAATEAQVLLDHDIRSLATALAYILRLRRPLPQWANLPGSGIDGVLVRSFASKVRSWNEAVCRGNATLAETVANLRSEKAKLRGLDEALQRLHRNESGIRHSPYRCKWVLAVFAKEDPWHEVVPAIISETVQSQHDSPLVIHAYSLREAEAILVEKLPHPSTKPFYKRPEPGLVLIGENQPDGSGLRFIERIWEKVETGDDTADWLMATYTYCTASSEAIRRIQRSRYSDLLRVILKTPDHESIERRLRLLISAPPGAVQSVPAIKIWEWTRQPLRVVNKKLKGETPIWEAAPTRQLSAVSVWDEPVFLTPWGFEIVRALHRSGGRCSREGIASRVYERYREWVEDIEGQDYAPLAEDEFVSWFAADSDDSPLNTQIDRVNELAARALVERKRAESREPMEAFAAPVIVSKPTKGSRIRLLCLAAEIDLYKDDIPGVSQERLRSKKAASVAVVEDDPYWVEQICEEVRRVSGVEPAIFQTAESAKHWCEQENPDGIGLYILDIKLEKLTAGLDLFEYLVQRPGTSHVIIVTGLDSPVVFNLLPYHRAPREYNLPPGLSSSEVIRRTRPPYIAKSDRDFITHLCQHVEAAWQSLVNAPQREIVAHIRMPLAKYIIHCPIVIELANGNIETINGADRYSWALIKVMGGWNPGVWLPEHLITDDIFDEVGEKVPTGWDFSQKFRPNAGVRGRLTRLGLFEDAGTGSCLYRLKADVMPPK